MRRRFGARVMAVAAVLATGLLASGCTPSVEEPAGFASEAEAFEAAVAHYEEYLEVLSRLETRSEAEQVLPAYVVGTALSDDLAGFDYFASQGWRSSGGYKFDGAQLLKADLDPVVEIQLALCMDVSDRRLLDSTGADVTPEREDRLPMVVTLVSPELGSLRVSGSHLGEEPVC